MIPAPGNAPQAPHADKTIEITVSLRGDVAVETKGFNGPSCRDASRFIEAALGERTSEALTPAFHRAVASLVEQVKTR